MCGLVRAVACFTLSSTHARVSSTHARVRYFTCSTQAIGGLGVLLALLALTLLAAYFTCSTKALGGLRVFGIQAICLLWLHV